MTRCSRTSKTKGTVDCTTSDSGFEDFKPLFNKLFLGEQYQNVDPYSCISFANIRGTSDSGVKLLIFLLEKTSAEPDVVHSTKRPLGSGTPLVNKLVGSLHSHLYEYFKDKAFDGKELEISVNMRELWYGIIDVEHSNVLVRWMVENKISWKNLSWFVTVLEGWHSVHSYRQLDRFQNRHHCPR